MFRREKQSTPTDTEPEAPTDRSAPLPGLSEELGRLRKTVLRQGHAQELFQARVEAAVERLGAVTRPEQGVPPSKEPTQAQLRALVELDQAVLQLQRMASGAGATGTRPEAPDEDSPASLREGFSLLQVRVRNLAHSMGLEPIPAAGRPFDDRRHRVEAVVERDDLPDGQVVEEVLPGYVLGERVVRPSRVVVNRRPDRS